MGLPVEELRGMVEEMCIIVSRGGDLALGLQQRPKGWQSLESVQAIWLLGSSL